MTVASALFYILCHGLMASFQILERLAALSDASARKRRKKMGKNSGKNFTEGWIEFEDKRVAKQIAQMLNGQPMGGKRRSAYHYDLWCLKYLSRFKWDHLTEEIGKKTSSCSSSPLPPGLL